MQPPPNQLPSSVKLSLPDGGARLNLTMSPPANVVAGASAALISTQESKVKDFAKWLGTEVALKKPSAEQPVSPVDLFSKKVPDTEVVLVVPSLDVPESEGKKSTALPGIGENRKSVAEGVGSSSSAEETRPNMAASVLTAASDNAAKVEQNAAQSINKQTTWTKAEVSVASEAFAKKAASFFKNLIDSRLRSWTLLILRHSLSTGETESRARFLRMLCASIDVQTSKTDFRTFELPPSAAGQPKEADVILPLLFEVVLNLSVQEQEQKMTVRAPGTMSGHFCKEDEAFLSKIVVNLDTGVMLNSMVDQARMLVFKAVAAATKAPLPPTALQAAAAAANNTVEERRKEETAPAAPLAAPVHQQRPAAPTAPTLSAGFRSALNLPSSNGACTSPGLQKARSSALRLNSILHGKSDSKKGVSSAGMRRNLSVKWDTPGQLPRMSSAFQTPDAKKQRMAQTAAKLKSFKSFGRPHAGDFGSGPRNATFGDFGGRVQAWGRDGRMAHHPTPMQSSGASQTGLTGVVEKNAVFDLNRLGVGNRASSSQAAGPAPSLPRTTTGLEKWLVQKSTGR